MPADPSYVRQAFSEIADGYVLANHALSLGIDVLWRRKAARLVARNQPATVLDVATGSGDLAAEIQRRLPSATVIGADFCAPMLAHARKRGLRNLIVADGMNLPFPDGAFDAVTVAFGLRNMPSYQGALREMARVLRPGGELMTLDFSLPRGRLLRGPYRFYLDRILPRLGGLITGKPEAYHYLARSIGEFPSGQAMIHLMERSGFPSTQWIPLCGGIASIYLAKA